MKIIHVFIHFILCVLVTGVYWVLIRLPFMKHPSEIIPFITNPNGLISYIGDELGSSIIFSCIIILLWLRPLKSLGKIKSLHALNTIFGMAMFYGTGELFFGKNFVHMMTPIECYLIIAGIIFCVFVFVYKKYKKRGIRS